MSSLIIKGDTSGAITLSAPNAAGDSTYTLPAVNGSVMVSGNMPAFSAFTTASVTCNNNTTVKMPFNGEQYDTANCYDNSTNYRFTPNVAGYYQINASIYFGGQGTGSNCWAQLIIRQNNAAQYYGSQIFMNNSSLFNVTGNCLIYCNGTTDYIECLFYQTNNNGNAITLNTVGSSTNMYSYFQGYLARAA